MSTSFQAPRKGPVCDPSHGCPVSSPCVGWFFAAVTLAYPSLNQPTITGAAPFSGRGASAREVFFHSGSDAAATAAETAHG